MDTQHKAIREILRTMSPKRAITYVKALELPENEELCIIECDIRRKSYIQVSMQLHVSPENIKQLRKKAYVKIADEVNNR